MSIEEKLDRIVMAIERLAERWAPEDSWKPTAPDFQPNSFTPGPTLPGPITTVPTPAFPPAPTTPTAAPRFEDLPTLIPHDNESFDWEAPVWRRFRGAQTKYLRVPAGFSGVIGLFMSQSTLNRADFATLTVMDDNGAIEVNPKSDLTTAGGMFKFFAVGPMTYRITCSNSEACISVNFLPGG